MDSNTDSRGIQENNIGELMTEEGGKSMKIPEYEVVVTMKNGNYVCQIPDLMLVATGNDLGLVYRELMRKKEVYKTIDQFIDPGAQEIRLKKLRKLVNKLKPYINEIKPLFAEESDPIDNRN
jgi:hypothetical protein